MIKIIILLLLPIGLLSQTEFKLHLNARNAKQAPLFDYYTKLSVTTVIDSIYTIKAMGNYERDEAVNYYSYSLGFNFKYGSSEYLKDTEKSIEYFSMAIFYPVKKWLKIGYDYMRTTVNNHSIYIGLKWKWAYLDLSFFDKIHKLKAVANPELKLSEHIKIGIEAGIISVQNELKWNTGLTLRYKL